MVWELSHYTWSCYPLTDNQGAYRWDGVVLMLHVNFKKDRCYGYRPLNKTDRATHRFLRFDTATRGFLKFDMQHWDVRDKRQGYFLNLTGDMGLKPFVTC